MKTRPRTAFTLFQLLVVLALLAILLGLLLPAVAKVRMAAARSQSQNNLKQIALAAHNYHDANAVFPSGVNANHFSAATLLLPYIEQDNVYQSIKLDKPVDDKVNAEVRKIRIKTFLNPMDPIVTVSMDYGATNYLFNAGSKPSLEDNDGIFYLDSKIKLADVTDGTSNTLLAGETLKGDGGVRAMTVKRQHVLFKKEALKDLKDDSGVKEFKDDKMIAADRCASWMDGRFLQGTFTGTRMLNDPKPDVNCGGAGGLSGLRGLEKGANTAFCDGSVRYLNENIEAKTWRLLTCRNDGEVLPDF
jgi:prepilin-type processing-associated H-X9-DG protein